MIPNAASSHQPWIRGRPPCWLWGHSGLNVPEEGKLRRSRCGRVSGDLASHLAYKGLLLVCPPQKPSRSAHPEAHPRGVLALRWLLSAQCAPHIPPAPEVSSESLTADRVLTGWPMGGSCALGVKLSSDREARTEAGLACWWPVASPSVGPVPRVPCHPGNVGWGGAHRARQQPESRPTSRFLSGRGVLVSHQPPANAVATSGVLAWATQPCVQTTPAPSPASPARPPRWLLPHPGVAFELCTLNFFRNQCVVKGI